MTPEDLSRRFPRLYHATHAEALPQIRRHGLLSTARLLALFETSLGPGRREAPVVLEHPRHGRAIITDNRPLQSRALAQCLEDGLDEAAWLRLLNTRVFFCPDQRRLDRLLAARFLRREPRLVLVFDALPLLRDHFDAVELAAINTGSAMRRPARRGLATFQPAARYSLADWRRLRGRRDDVHEITVLDGIADPDRYLLDTYTVRAASR